MPRNLFGQRLAPRAQLGDLVLVLGQSAFRNQDGTSAYEVTGLEALTGIGRHGALVVWSGGAVPAGYAADVNAAIGAIGPGSALNTTPLQGLKNAADEITQVRFLFKQVGALPAGWAMSDLDVGVAQPGSTRRWGTSQLQGGVVNAMLQVPFPTDTWALPAQGQDMDGPTTAIANPSPFDAAYLTELFIHRDEAPSFVLQNNGAVAMDSEMAVAIVVAGFKYKLSPISSLATVQTDRQLLGLPARVPSWVTDEYLRNDVPILPVASRF